MTVLRSSPSHLPPLSLSHFTFRLVELKLMVPTALPPGLNKYEMSPDTASVAKICRQLNVLASGLLVRLGMKGPTLQLFTL